MRRVVLSLAVLFSGNLPAMAAQHAAQGMVLSADAAQHTIVVSCDAIPGYMAAMDMPFLVGDRNAFVWLKPGAMIRFTIDGSAKRLRAEKIEQVVNFEPEPADAGGLSALNAAMRPDAPKPVEIGHEVPDFTLIDQTGRAVRLSEFRGKVVALTFGYSRCPYPTYCLRLSRNLEQVEHRFHAQAGRDLVLITVAIDPEYDKGPVLAEYARSFHADPAVWHFLTGPLQDVQAVAGRFGMNFWRSEGQLTHTLYTVVIDRQGRLAANIDGNQFTPTQLGDLVDSVMNPAR
jgi:protein SCO1